MKFTFLRAIGAAALLASTSIPAKAAIISLKCIFTRSLVGAAYDGSFPLSLNIWIHTRVSVADVQRYLGGIYGLDPAPVPHPVLISTGYFKVDVGNGGFLISIIINRMTGIGEYDNNVMFVPQTHAYLVADYKCVKSNAPLPKGKF